MATRDKVWVNIDWITFLVFLLLMYMGWRYIYAAVYKEGYKSIFDF